MPIIGVSDESTRNETPPSYPVWAMVKKGDEKPKRGPGRNLSYFRFEWKDDAAEIAFNRIFGERDIQSVFIQTLSHDVDSVFDSHYRKYTSNNVLQILCDGCHIKRALNKDLLRGDALCICDPIERDDKTNAKTCAPSGYLYFTIPEMESVMGYRGQFILRTGSLEEIQKIASVLHGTLLKVGTLVDMPFRLQRNERKYDQQKEDGTPVQFTQWNVELVPPSDKILQERFGLALPRYLNETQVMMLPEAETQQLPAAQDEIVELEQDENDTQEERSPGIPENSLNALSQFLEKTTGQTLADLLNNMREIADSVLTLEQLVKMPYEAISYHIMAHMAICGVGFKINTLEWDNSEERHEIHFMSETILLFSRDPFRKAGAEEDFVDLFKQKSVKLTEHLSFDELPMIYVNHALDKQGEHKYFSVASVRLNHLTIDPLGDIPF